MKNLLSIVTVTLLLAGCKSPFDRTRDASNAGALGTFSTTGHFVIFSNELKTGGGAFAYPAGDNQILSFADTSNPVSARSIRYFWSGQAVAAQTVFAGFDLMHTADLSSYTTTPGRNLTAAGYNQMTFFARGSLGSNVVLKVEAADDGTAGGAQCVVLSASGLTSDPGSPTCSLGQLGSGWGTYSVSGIAGSLGNVKDFFKATLIVVAGGSSTGGTVYFDQIEFAP